MTVRKRQAFDPVTLQIMWSRLIQVTNEQAAALMRTSFTPIVRDVGDLSAAVFDPQGRMLAQAVTGTPGHINSLATGMKHFLAAHPAKTLKAGDVLITNDPWMTSGQLNDLSVVTPVFDRRRLVGFFGNTCHAIDIGGLGLSADATEVFEEGLYIPVLKLYEAGRANQTLFAMLAANVRTPPEVLGDLHAQVAANQVGAERLLEYLRETGQPDLTRLGGEILTRSESAMRRAIAHIPDGRYERVCFTDGDEEPIRIQCALTIAGDEVTADFTGSSDQVSRAYNVVLNYTSAYTNYGLKLALCPEVPQNDGSFRPVHVLAPAGSIFNPRFPAAVAARQVAGHFIVHAIFGALSQVVPERVIAEGAGNIWLTTVRGAGSKRFVAVFFAAGGMGARPDADGLSTTAFPSGVASAPVEVIETSTPLVFRRKEWRPDSGGAGRFRGGLGQTIEVEVRTGEDYILSVLSDRFTRPAQGYAGGEPGAGAGFRTSAGGRGNPRRSRRLSAGTSFTLELPGGGGFFAPTTRAQADAKRDLDDGLVSGRQAGG